MEPILSRDPTTGSIIVTYPDGTSEELFPEAAAIIPPDWDIDGWTWGTLLASVSYDAANDTWSLREEATQLARGQAPLPGDRGKVQQATGQSGSGSTQQGQGTRPGEPEWFKRLRQFNPQYKPWEELGFAPTIVEGSAAGFETYEPKFSPEQYNKDVKAAQATAELLGLIDEADPYGKQLTNLQRTMAQFPGMFNLSADKNGMPILEPVEQQSGLPVFPPTTAGKQAAMEFLAGSGVPGAAVVFDFKSGGWSIGQAAEADPLTSAPVYTDYNTAARDTPPGFHVVSRASSNGQTFFTYERIPAQAAAPRLSFSEELDRAQADAFVSGNFDRLFQLEGIRDAIAAQPQILGSADAASYAIRFAETPEEFLELTAAFSEAFSQAAGIGMTPQQVVSNAMTGGSRGPFMDALAGITAGGGRQTRALQAAGLFPIENTDAHPGQTMGFPGGTPTTGFAAELMAKNAASKAADAVIANEGPFDTPDEQDLAWSAAYREAYDAELARVTAQQEANLQSGGPAQRNPFSHIEVADDGTIVLDDGTVATVGGAVFGGDAVGGPDFKKLQSVQSLSLTDPETGLGGTYENIDPEMAAHLLAKKEPSTPRVAPTQPAPKRDPLAEYKKRRAARTPGPRSRVTQAIFR